MRTQNFGDISVTKVLDGTDNFKAAIAFPGVDLNHFHQHHDWIRPFYNFENESFLDKVESPGPQSKLIPKPRPSNSADTIEKPWDTPVDDNIPF